MQFTLFSIFLIVNNTNSDWLLQVPGQMEVITWHFLVPMLARGESQGFIKPTVLLTPDWWTQTNNLFWFVRCWHEWSNNVRSSSCSSRGRIWTLCCWTCSGSGKYSLLIGWHKMWSLIGYFRLQQLVTVLIIIPRQRQQQLRATVSGDIGNTLFWLVDP